MTHSGATVIALPEPGMFRSVLPDTTFLQPEKRLLVAILDDAIRTLLKPVEVDDRAGRRLLADAEAWLAADDFAWCFSFVNVCETLSLDAACIRTWLARRRTVRRGSPAPLAHVPRPAPQRLAGWRRPAGPRTDWRLAAQ